MRNYLVILGDGMADTPVPALGNKTPLMVANKPNIDYLASRGEVGIAYTVPHGMKPGSDVANLAMMGYDPAVYYSGRSPLEAMSMGVDFNLTDVTYRCNLVTVSDAADYKDTTMVDYSAGEITSEEARQLIEALESALGNEYMSFYPGVSYRHCLLLRRAKDGADLTPPHDITGKPVAEYLPKGQNSELLYDLMRKSRAILMSHPINKSRIARGLNPANSIWLWGEGRKPNLTNFEEKNHLKGAVISAVDLIKGIGKVAGMKVCEVEGATGTYKTNFKGKAEACIQSYKEGYNYVYIHMEAPDECGHQGDTEHKVLSIELIDSLVVGPVREYLESTGEPYTILVAPDHPTPLAIRTHTSDPIPYIIYRSDREAGSGVDTYNEMTARSTGIIVDHAYTLIDRMK